MESFSAEWLALREPADHAARDERLVADVAARLTRHRSRRAVDLAGGTGSNIRYLLPRLPHITHWTLVDHDDRLLEVAMRTLTPLAAGYGVVIEARQADVRDLAQVPLAACALVTASALLDLVSPDWLRTLVHHAREARAELLLALSYDGRIVCDPMDPEDARVTALVNRHQRTDKGFGPALGPDAWREAEVALADWEVTVATTDWVLTPADGALQAALVEGWAAAASAIAPGKSAGIMSWRDRRQAHILGGRSSMRVGHRDVAARPV